MTNPDELERLAKAATPGPWQNGFDDLEGVVSLGAKDDGNVVCLPPASFMELSQVRWDDNAAFIAAANPATILDLLAANRKMREAIERLMDAEFAKDWRTWSDERARLLLGVGPRFDAFMEARSALSTKETT